MNAEDINQQEFLVYVSLHAAYADLHLSENEIAQMRSKYGAIAFDKVKLQYESQTEYENLKTIASLKSQFYPGEEGTDFVLEHMLETFNADGDYNRLEKTSYTFLRRFLQRNLTAKADKTNSR